MPNDSLSRISVCVLDEGGLLQVRGGEAHYSGLLPRVPEALSIGDSMHIRVTSTKDGGVETLDLLGSILLLEGGPGPVPLTDGLIFEVEVSHQSRRAILDANALAASAEMPADDDARAEAADAADEDTLHASPINPHPAPEMLEAGALSEASLDDQAPLISAEESPIHFRPVDVERRVADADELALLERSLPADDEAIAAADDEVRESAGLADRLASRLSDVDLPAAGLSDDELLAAEAELEEELSEEEPLSDEELLAAEAELEQDLAAASARDESPAAAPSHDDDGFSHEEVTAHERGGSRRRARSGYDATEPSGIVGTLREMALTEVVQSLEFSGKTAQIDVRPKESDVPHGVVFVEGGHVTHARCGAIEGDEAFFLLADQHKGAFLIRFHAKAPSRNVHQPTAYLLLEALRRKDEEAHEKSLVESVASEERARDEDGAEADVDATLLSDGLSAADPGVTEPFGRLPAPPLDDVTRIERPGAERAPAPVEYELDDEAVEEQLVAAYEAPKAPPPREKRPYATAAPTTIFSRFFEEASEEAERPPLTADEADDVSDPTFSGLKAALKGLKRSDEDTLAAFEQPVSSGSFPSFP